MNDPIDGHQVSKGSHRRSKDSIIKHPSDNQRHLRTCLSNTLHWLVLQSFHSIRRGWSPRGPISAPRPKKNFQFGQNKLTAVCFCWPSEVVWADPKTETKKNRSIPVGTHSLRPHWLRPLKKNTKMMEKKNKERGRSSASFSLCRSLISVFSLLWLTGLTTPKKMALLFQVRQQMMRTTRFQTPTVTDT